MKMESWRVPHDSNLEDIDSSEVLKNSMRTHLNGGLHKLALKVFEAQLHINETIGIFRLGISLEPLNTINERLTRRIIFLELLFVFGFITITLILVRQYFDLLSKRFTAIESYSVE